MRVLHINAGNMFGGVETLLVTLARCRQLCPEMQPSFALCFEGRLSKELQEANVPVHFLDEVRTSRFWSVLKSRRKLRALLNRENFDVVLTHMCWSHAIFGPEVKRAGLPLVNWVHGVMDGTHWLERWARRISPDLALCNSRFTANAATRLFGDCNKEVVYVPVMPAPGAVHNREPRSAVRHQLGAKEESVVILQASRMEPWKGHRLQLHALAQLQDLPNWVCWIAGGAQRENERKYSAELERLAHDLGIAHRVRFLGQRTDLPRLMAAADIFSQPNEQPEPFGIVFIEAMSTGLPVVTTRMGGAAEIVDDSCGVLCSKEAATLASSLRRLIENRELRSALAAAGPGRARELCDPASQLRKLQLVLTGITRNGKILSSLDPEAARAN